MSQRLHILFLSSWYPSRVLPTNGDFIQRHAEAVATLHQVSLIHVISGASLNQDIEVTANQINGVKTLIAYTKPSKNPIVKWIRFFRAYRLLLKQIEPFNLVHLNVIFPAGLFALYLKWYKKKPYIISEHWTDYQFPLNKRISFYIKLLTKIIVKHSSFVCPVSKHLQDAMINFGLTGNYYPVPNVVNTQIFNYQKKEPDIFTITHISNMDDNYKNVSGILNVISKLQEKIKLLKINLIGQDAEKYRALIEKLNIKNYEIIGQIEHHKVADYLNKSNVLVLFSNYENLPCVILEAFACGVPVVSTQVGGINEYFPEGFGKLIPPKDENALENALYKIYNSELKPKKQEMHQYAETHFSPQTISTIFTDLYYKTLKIKY